MAPKPGQIVYVHHVVVSFIIHILRIGEQRFHHIHVRNGLHFYSFWKTGHNLIFISCHYHANWCIELCKIWHDVYWSLAKFDHYTLAVFDWAYKNDTIFTCEMGKGKFLYTSYTEKRESLWSQLFRHLQHRRLPERNRWCHQRRQICHHDTSAVYMVMYGVYLIFFQRQWHPLRSWCVYYSDMGATRQPCITPDKGWAWVVMLGEHEQRGE